MARTWLALAMCALATACGDDRGSGSDGGSGGADAMSMCTPSCAGRTCGSDGCSGQCGTCSGDSVCLAGMCQAGGCPSGLFACDGECVDLLVDPLHCGSCVTACEGEPGVSEPACLAAECAVRCAADPPGVICAGEDACTGGHCCGPSEEFCGGACASREAFSDDPMNCGGCGIVCPSAGGATPACTDFACRISCDGPGRLEVCGSVCRNLDTDVDHCGECDNACPPSDVPGEVVSCDSGSCSSSCPGGDHCLGVCVDMDTDAQNCGVCGLNCAGAACSAGTCVGGGDVMALGMSSVPGSGVLRIRHPAGSGALEWGTVCDDNFGPTDATVACRQLGFSGGTSSTSTIPGTGVIWMDEVMCTGTESRLSDCSFPGWNVHDCDHSEDVWLDCTP